MARQPEIRLGRIRMPQGTSPQQTVNRARNKLQVADSLYTIGKQVGDIKQQFDVGEASAETSARMGEFEQAYAGKEVYTPEEVEALGLEGIVATEENGERREFIPAHEVYPIALQQAGEEAIKAGRDKISSSRLRQSWSNEMSARHEQVVSKAIDTARGNAYRFAVQSMTQEAQELQDRGLFVAAEQKILAMPVPEAQKQPLLMENERKAEESGINAEIMQSDVVQLGSLVDRLYSDEYAAESTLSPEKRRELANTALARQQNMENLYWKMKGRAQDQTASALLEEVFNGRAGQTDIDAYREQLGFQNYRMLSDKVRAISQSSPARSDPMLQSTWNQKLIEIEYGQYGPDHTLDDLESDATMWLLSNMGMTGPDGNIRPGLTPEYVQSARTQLRSTIKQVMDNPTYKQIMQDAGQRIANIAGEGFMSAPPKEENAYLLAEFRAEIQQYIREEGPNAKQLREYAESRLPDYLSQKGKAAAQKIPQGLWGDVVYSRDNVLDVDATMQKLAARYEKYQRRMESNPGNNRARTKLQELEADIAALESLIKMNEVETSDGSQ